jgi:hypothetical protein
MPWSWLRDVLWQWIGLIQRWSVKKWQWLGWRDMVADGTTFLFHPDGTLVDSVYKHVHRPTIVDSWPPRSTTWQKRPADQKQVAA